MNTPWAVIEKGGGETPLSAIELWRKENMIPSSVPLSYAGRLDPMASGKILILIGDECKKQKEYTGLDKEYFVEVLFNIATDTGDILGLPKHNNSQPSLSIEEIEKVLHQEEGSHLREYPAFSSKTVEGKPLFLYALEKKLDTITIPTHTETIYTIKNKEVETLTQEELKSKIFFLLSKVPRTQEESKKLGADFRQDEIRAAWDLLFKETANQKFFVLPIQVICASGTYMRTLAPRIGEALGTKAIALSIHRSKIGIYNDSTHEWKKEFE